MKLIKKIYNLMGQEVVPLKMKLPAHLVNIKVRAVPYWGEESIEVKLDIFFDGESLLDIRSTVPVYYKWIGSEGNLSTLKKIYFRTVFKDLLTENDVEIKLLNLLKGDKDLWGLKVPNRESGFYIDLNDPLGVTERLIRSFVDSLFEKGKGILKGVKDDGFN